MPPFLRSLELQDRITKLKRCSTNQDVYCGKPSVVDLEVTDDVTNQVKIKLFEDSGKLLAETITKIGDGWSVCLDDQNS